jgi:hypothetical protein
MSASTGSMRDSEADERPLSLLFPSLPDAEDLLALTAFLRVPPAAFAVALFAIA